MSEDQSPDQSPTLPKAGRPSKAELDERAAELDERGQELARREAAVMEAEANATAEFEAVEGAKRQLQDAAALSSLPGQSGALPPRQSIDEGVERTPGDNPIAMRAPMRQGKWLADTRPYEAKYHDKTLMWINDMSGDVQQWIDQGAEPVPVLTRSDRVFEGITDKVESKWVRSVGGGDGMGGHFWVYLLMIDPQRYDEVKLAPERARQELIRRAMVMARDNSEMTDGPKLPTYQANLPTGDGVGVSVTRETVR